MFKQETLPCHPLFLFFNLIYLYITFHGDFGLVVLHFNPLASLPSLLAQTLHVSFSYYSQAPLKSTQDSNILICYIKYMISVWISFSVMKGGS